MENIFLWKIYVQRHFCLLYRKATSGKRLHEACIATPCEIHLQIQTVHFHISYTGTAQSCIHLATWVYTLHRAYKKQHMENTSRYYYIHIKLHLKYVLLYTYKVRVYPVYEKIYSANYVCIHGMYQIQLKNILWIHILLYL